VRPCRLSVQLAPLFLGQRNPEHEPAAGLECGRGLRAAGLAAWRAAGRRVVQGLNVPSKVFGERALHEWGTPQIAPHELMRRIDKRDDLVIVDSRTFEEYHRGCIPGSISVPGGELVLRIGELVERPETTIVVHCGGRTRSYIGAE